MEEITVKNEEQKDNVIDITETTPAKKKFKIFGKRNHETAEKEEVKVEEETGKKKLSKREKAARIGAGVVIGATVLFGVGKAVANHFIGGDTVELAENEISCDGEEPVESTEDTSASEG